MRSAAVCAARMCGMMQARPSAVAVRGKLPRVRAQRSGKLRVGAPWSRSHTSLLRGCRASDTGVIVDTDAGCGDVAAVHVVCGTATADCGSQRWLRRGVASGCADGDSWPQQPSSEEGVLAAGEGASLRGLLRCTPWHRLLLTCLCSDRRVVCLPRQPNKGKRPCSHVRRRRRRPRRV